MKRILLVEDDKAVQQFVCTTLAHYEVETVLTIAEAVDRVQVGTIDLVLLDILLGAENGIEVARQIRAFSPYTAIVILTGHGSLRTAIDAIALNVQAYLLKPIKPAELRLVVKQEIEKMEINRQKHELAEQVQRAVATITARTDAELQTNVLVSGVLRLNRERYEALYNQCELSLSPAQFRILWILVSAAGQPVLPVRIAQEALGYQVSESEAGDLVKGHISHIRRKLAGCNPTHGHILTIRGEGYLWVK